MLQAIVGYWENVRWSYCEEDQCLIFCRTIKDVKSIGDALGVPSYHRECSDGTPVQQFRTGVHRIYPQL